MFRNSKKNENFSRNVINHKNNRWKSNKIITNNIILSYTLLISGLVDTKYIIF